MYRSRGFPFDIDPGGPCGVYISIQGGLVWYPSSIRLTYISYYGKNKCLLLNSIKSSALVFYFDTAVCCCTELPFTIIKFTDCMYALTTPTAHLQQQQQQQKRTNEQHFYRPPPVLSSVHGWLYTYIIAQTNNQLIKNN